MTEYEAATLALRETALAVQQACPWATFVVGLGKIAVLYYDVRTMATMNGEYAREAEERHDWHTRAMKAEKRRHREAMPALHELIRRTAPAQGR